jgi:hypothetical protein
VPESKLRIHSKLLHISTGNLKLSYSESRTFKTIQLRIVGNSFHRLYMDCIAPVRCAARFHCQAWGGSIFSILLLTKHYIKNKSWANRNKKQISGYDLNVLFTAEPQRTPRGYLKMQWVGFCPKGCCSSLSDLVHISLLFSGTQQKVKGENYSTSLASRAQRAVKIFNPKKIQGKGRVQRPDYQPLL